MNMKIEAEYMAIGVGEPRLYVSQYWVIDDTTRPMLRIVAGPFNYEYADAMMEARKK